MAKKINPQDMTVEDKLKYLYQLQTIYTEIDKIKTLRGELPLEVQDLEDEIAGLQTRVGNFSTDIQTLRAADNEHRRNIDESQRLVEKYTKDLDNVRNNREFDSLNKEIEYENLEIELSNKRLRENAAKQKTALEEIARLREIIDDKQMTLDDKKSELDDIIAETRQKEEELRDEAKKKELLIETRLLMSFKRIRKNTRNGLAIVYVQRGACGGCFNHIPPQRQLDIKMRKKIIVCEYCGRIMIDPELAGVKIVAPTETAKKKRSTRRKKAETETAVATEKRGEE
jgi:predicted  nucleic acid-binding Zn-ribbon protein